MIRICDAIMGSGKTQGAITYMNEHSEDRYIYITPYLDEAERIKAGCPELNFVEPSNQLIKYNNEKIKHTAALIKMGVNITTTHQAFKSYTRDMLNDIKEKEYTLIIDESVDVLKEIKVKNGDINLFIDAGYITENNGVYSYTGKDYSDISFQIADILRLMSVRKLIKINSEDKNAYYWALPKELLTSFKDVFVLTYLFKAQSLHHFLEINNIQYEYIGVKKSSDTETGYRFTSKEEGQLPDYVQLLGSKIHIIMSEKLNKVGDNYYALSMNWFGRNEDVKTLKNNISNCFNHIWADTSVNGRLWGTYKNSFPKLKGSGYTNAFLTFNAKATNKYRDRTRLVYAANVFMNASEKVFYSEHGIEVNEDIYALSAIVQWIWRSAIRDGKEIYVYIPSKRMRNIFINWINSLSNVKISTEEESQSLAVKKKAHKSKNFYDLCKEIQIRQNNTE